jgi:hypothetical protein
VTRYSVNKNFFLTQLKVWVGIKKLHFYLLTFSSFQTEISKNVDDFYQFKLIQTHTSTLLLTENNAAENHLKLMATPYLFVFTVEKNICCYLPLDTTSLTLIPDRYRYLPLPSCRPFDDSAGGFACAAFEILLSSISSTQDPRRFDTDLDPQTVLRDSKFFCFFLTGTVVSTVHLHQSSKR